MQRAPREVIVSIACHPEAQRRRTSPFGEGARFGRSVIGTPSVGSFGVFVRMTKCLGALRVAAAGRSPD